MLPTILDDPRYTGGSFKYFVQVNSGVGAELLRTFEIHQHLVAPVALQHGITELIAECLEYQVYALQGILEALLFLKIHVPL